MYCAIGDSLPQALLDTVVAAEALPVLTLEPWEPSGSRGQTPFSLKRIIAGALDADLRRWAHDLASWGKPVLLRFAQEMNGAWYPWSIGVNDNTANAYRMAWARLHAIISEKAPNVKYVWAPNAITEGTSDFRDCYPGTDLVDYLGLDGYNWGAAPGHQWQSAEKLFSSSIAALSSLDANLPILISEVGCAEGHRRDLKASWIRDFFTVIDANDQVSGFLWFQMDKERDWRFNSSPVSTGAFRESLSQWRRP
ncbi:glycoside hydrolase family 26 protein [Gordonia alkanivorans]|uniref:glycoside hydrolase family 26 protein n=1 Tax=Gordonia alkanivorans TaxID=84096 RepID=UPI00244B9639|nr:glycosyl hydrolase [Gordonia alkanivorans]MDH3009312.1 glycosyl hydrolase [Gordonia alkanivorans]